MRLFSTDFMDDNYYSLRRTELGKEYRAYQEGEAELTEYVIPCCYAVIITDEKGQRPKGNTNDGFLDTVHSDVQAVVPVKEGYHILCITYKGEGNNVYYTYDREKPLTVIVHKIVGIQNTPMSFNNKSYLLKTEQIFDYEPSSDYGIFNYALKFVSERVIDNHITSGSIPRFAVHPSRKYAIGLFVWDGKDHVSYMPNGKKVVLHKGHGKYMKERQRGTRSEKPTSGFLMRYFYEDKQMRYPYIVVDGYTLFDGMEREVKEKYGDKLVQCQTYSGFTFLAVKDENGLSAVYDSWAGIRSFKLNTQESKFVKSISEKIEVEI